MGRRHVESWPASFAGTNRIRFRGSGRPFGLRTLSAFALPGGDLQLLASYRSGRGAGRRTVPTQRQRRPGARHRGNRPRLRRPVARRTQPGPGRAAHRRDRRGARSPDPVRRHPPDQHLVPGRPGHVARSTRAWPVFSSSRQPQEADPGAAARSSPGPWFGGIRLTRSRIQATTSAMTRGPSASLWISCWRAG